MRSMATDDRHMGHIAPSSPAGSHSSDPVSQEVGSSLQLGRYEPDHEPLH
jgi:hypothetical protein